MAMSQKFTTLLFDLKYFERGMGFKGRYIVKSGTESYDERWDYHGNRGG